MDKIRFFFIALLGMGAAHLSAQTADSTQTSPWTTEGFAGLKLTQVSLTNWSAGGDNSVAFDLQGTYQANYKKGKHIWNSWSGESWETLPDSSSGRNRMDEWEQEGLNLRKKLRERLDQTREVEDQEIYRQIDDLILEETRNRYVSLRRKEALRTELFNSIRK